MLTKGNGMLLVAILFAFFTSRNTPLYAQGETAHWYFGVFCGVDFGPGGSAPSVLIDGRTNTIEGTSTVSDPYGNLLFYTDGRTVWNRNHLVMPSGSGLTGGASSAQAAMIVRQPNSDHIYYIFTTFHMAGTPGLGYSVVDMSADGGMGDVVSLNVPLLDPSAEKLTAARHANGIDIWILGHGWDDDLYHAWLLTPSGLSSTPVTSAAGAVHGLLPDNAIGYLRANPQGNRIAAAVYKQNLVELSDFDRATGAVSNVIALPQDDWVYGVEFSPDGSKLYTTNQVLVPQVVQYNLENPDPAVIAASQTVVGIPSIPQPGGIAMASDGKIYISGWGNHLSRIESPNLAGTACTYSDNVVNLGSGLAKLSVPNFPPILFMENSLEAEGECTGDTAVFMVAIPADVDSVIWDFGDPASGADNIQNALTGTHVYTAAGTYTVTALLYGWGPVDTLTTTISPMNGPLVSLPGDTTLCPGLGALEIYPSITDATTISWHDGSSTPLYIATSAGMVWLQASNACASVTDSVEVMDGALPLDLGEDIIACDQDDILLDAGSADLDYLWSTGDTSSSIWVDLPGTYMVTAVDPLTGCFSQDSVAVSFESVVVDLGPDTVLSSGSTLVLDASYPGATYLWSTGSTDPLIEVSEAGVYTVTVTDVNGCEGITSIVVDFASGIAEAFADGDFTLGPVPAVQVVHLNWQGTSSWEGMVTVRHMDGRLAVQKYWNFGFSGSLPIEIQYLSAGTYLLDLERNSGERSIRKFLRIE